MKEYKNTMKRGDIFYAELSPVVGSEQGGTRPVLILQNNLGNHYSPTIIVAAMTSCMCKTSIPTHITIEGKRHGLREDSVVLLEQIRTIDRIRFREYIGHLDEQIMEQVETALAVSLGLEMVKPELQSDATGIKWAGSIMR